MAYLILFCCTVYVSCGFFSRSAAWNVFAVRCLSLLLGYLVTSKKRHTSRRQQNQSLLVKLAISCPIYCKMPKTKCGGKGTELNSSDFDKTQKLKAVASDTLHVFTAFTAAQTFYPLVLILQKDQLLFGCWIKMSHRIKRFFFLSFFFFLCKARRLGS